MQAPMIEALRHVERTSTDEEERKYAEYLRTAIEMGACTKQNTVYVTDAEPVTQLGDISVYVIKSH
jgi:hypothetical protein